MRQQRWPACALHDQLSQVVNMSYLDRHCILQMHPCKGTHCVQPHDTSCCPHRPGRQPQPRTATARGSSSCPSPASAGGKTQPLHPCWMMQTWMWRIACALHPLPPPWTPGLGLLLLNGSETDLSPVSELLFLSRLRAIVHTSLQHGCGKGSCRSAGGKCEPVTACHGLQEVPC